MKKTVYDLFYEVIEGVSGKVNKKALHEILDNNQYCYDYNYLLMSYYNRIHGVKNTSNFMGFISINDFNDIVEFKDYIKLNYNSKWYKNDYDYKNIGKCKQKNTGLLIGFHNGSHVWSSWVFNVDEFIEVNNIEVI